MKFNNTLFILLFCFIVIFVILLYHKKNTIEITVYNIKDGYGYSLQMNKKILIKQDYIPAIQERSHFCTYSDAYKVGTIVKNKIEHGEGPGITLEELKENNISFLCN